MNRTSSKLRGIEPKKSGYDFHNIIDRNIQDVNKDPERLQFFSPSFDICLG